MSKEKLLTQSESKVNLSQSQDLEQDNEDYNEIFEITMLNFLKKLKMNKLNNQYIKVKPNDYIKYIQQMVDQYIKEQKEVNKEVLMDDKKIKNKEKNHIFCMKCIKIEQIEGFVLTNLEQNTNYEELKKELKKTQYRNVQETENTIRNYYKPLDQRFLQIQLLCQKEVQNIQNDSNKIQISLVKEKNSYQQFIKQRIINNLNIMDRVRSRSRIENFDPYEMDDFDIAIEKITEFINKMQQLVFYQDSILLFKNTLNFIELSLREVNMSWIIDDQIRIPGFKVDSEKIMRVFNCDIIHEHYSNRIKDEDEPDYNYDYNVRFDQLRQKNLQHLYEKIYQWPYDRISVKNKKDCILKCFPKSEHFNQVNLKLLCIDILARFEHLSQPSINIIIHVLNRSFIETEKIYILQIFNSTSRSSRINSINQLNRSYSSSQLGQQNLYYQQAYHEQLYQQFLDPQQITQIKDSFSDLNDQYINIEKLILNQEKLIQTNDIIQLDQTIRDKILLKKLQCAFYGLFKFTQWDICYLCQKPNNKFNKDDYNQLYDQKDFITYIIQSDYQDYVSYLYNCFHLVHITCFVKQIQQQIQINKILCGYCKQQLPSMSGTYELLYEIDESRLCGKLDFDQNIKMNMIRFGFPLTYKQLKLLLEEMKEVKLEK